MKVTPEKLRAACQRLADNQDIRLQLQNIEQSLVAGIVRKAGSIDGCPRRKDALVELCQYLRVVRSLSDEPELTAQKIMLQEGRGN